MGRKPTGTPILVRIPPELLAQIDTGAATDGTTRAEQIRRILTHHYTKDSP